MNLNQYSLDPGIYRVGPMRPHETVEVSGEGGVTLENCEEISSLQIFGKSVQDGAPSIDAPQEIRGAGGRMIITASEKTPISLPQEHPKVGIYSAKVGESISMSMTSNTSYLWIIEIKPNTTYSCKVESKNGSKFEVEYALTDSNRIVTASELRNPKTATYKKEVIKSGEASKIYLAIVQVGYEQLKIQLEEYGQSRNITLSVGSPLHGIPVSVGGNYIDTSGQRWIADEIDLGRGKYIKRTQELQIADATEWRLGGLVLDKDVYEGWDEFEPVPDDVANHFEAVYSNYPLAAPEKNTALDAMCTHFPLQKTTGKVNTGNFRVAQNTNGEIFVLFAPVRDVIPFEDWESWKTWVSENSPVVLVPQEPVETDLTEEEIAAYRELVENSTGTVHLTAASGEVQPGIKVIYKKGT